MLKGVRGYESLLTSFNRDACKVVNTLSILTGLAIKRGFNIARYCKSSKILHILESIDMNKVAYTNVEGYDVIFTLPLSVDELLTKEQSRDNSDELFSLLSDYSAVNSNDNDIESDLELSNIFPSDCFVVRLNYDFVRIEYNNDSYILSNDNLDILKDYIKLLITSEKSVKLCRSLAHYSCMTLNTAVLRGSQYIVDTLRTYEDFGDIDNARLIAKCDENFVKLLPSLLCVVEAGVLRSDWSNRNAVVSWVRFYSDSINNRDIVSYSTCYEYLGCSRIHSVSSAKMLPSLLYYHIHKVKDVDELVDRSNGYMSYDASSFKRSNNKVKDLDDLVDRSNGYMSYDDYYFKRSIKIRIQNKDVYFDGNMSVNRACSKFIDALRNLGLNLADFRCDSGCSI